MILDEFINNKYNVLVSIKKININSNEHIYIYGIHDLCESTIKYYNKDHRVIFLDKYIGTKYIIIQRNADFTDVFNANFEVKHFNFFGEFIIMSNENIESLCPKVDLINHSNKIYIITYYNTVYRSLVQKIIFDENDLK